MKRSMRKRDYEAMAGFRYLLRRFLRFSEDVTQQHGITPLQYQLMLQLKGFPGRSHATITELAERLQSKHHGVVALVSRCEEIGLVRRQPSVHDLRQVEVHLSASGERVLEGLALLHRDEFEALLALLSELDAAGAADPAAA